MSIYSGIAVWAIKSIQDEGSHYQQKENVGLSHIANTDYGLYPCHLNGDKGRLIISSRSLRLETNIGHQVVFVLNYDLISKVEKIERNKSKLSPGSDTGRDLRVCSRLNGDGEWILMGMEDRNQAFSQIIGFSETRWQVAW